MSDIKKINRTAVLDLKDFELDAFIKNLFVKGRTGTTYDGIKLQLDTLEPGYLKFSNCLAMSIQYKGKDRTQNTFNARKDIGPDFESLVAKVEVLAPAQQYPDDYVMGLGFVYDATPTRKTAIVKPPIVKTWKSGGSGGLKANLPGYGKVHVVLGSDIANEIRMVEAIRSDDNGKTWVNAGSDPKLSFLLKDQPSGVKALYSFRFLASNNRESDWSEPVLIGIY